MAAALPISRLNMRFWAPFTALLIVLLAAPGAAGRQPAQPDAARQSAQQLAAAVQAAYDRIHDFSADFTQDYTTTVLKRKTSESGKVQVKKPGKMRWDYLVPEKKALVSDGSRIYWHVPADNQVTISPVPKQDEATTALLFLVGKGNLTRDFNVSFSGAAPAGSRSLRLDPKLPERDYEWLQLVIDEKTLQIRTLAAPDRQGGQSTFHFSNFKGNVGIPDKTFNFKIPNGADVRNAASPSR
jgi:outer membrane lipoprotein carrier protein